MSWACRKAAFSWFVLFHGNHFRCLRCQSVRLVRKNRMASRIVINPEVCGGRPIVAGTRVRVADILAMLAGGASEAEVLADFPYLSAEDIRASLAYAAQAVDHSVIQAAA